jgi:regulator of replication initiation timing
MKHKGIPTNRVSKAETERMALLIENEKLRAENKKLKKVIAAIAASESLDPTLQEIVFEGLDEEMRNAIFANSIISA